MISSDPDTCVEFEESMGAALSGDASAKEIRLLDKHLDNCPKCAEIFSGLARFRDRLLEKYSVEAPICEPSAAVSAAVLPRSFGPFRMLATAGLAASVVLAIYLQEPSAAPASFDIPETVPGRSELSAYVGGELELMTEDELIQFLSEDEITELLEYFDDEFTGV